MHSGLKTTHKQRAIDIRNSTLYVLALPVETGSAREQDFMLQQWGTGSYQTSTGRRYPSLCSHNNLSACNVYKPRSTSQPASLLQCNGHYIGYECWRARLPLRVIQGTALHPARVQRPGMLFLFATSTTTNYFKFHYFFQLRTCVLTSAADPTTTNHYCKLLLLHQLLLAHPCHFKVSVVHLLLGRACRRKQIGSHIQAHYRPGLDSTCVRACLFGVWKCVRALVMDVCLNACVPTSASRCAYVCTGIICCSDC